MTPLRAKMLFSEADNIFYVLTEVMWSKADNGLFQYYLTWEWCT